MHSFKKTALTCAVAALTLGSQMASAGFSQFYEDATISGKLRTTYQDIEKRDRVDTTTKKGISNSTAGAWTGGLMLDAKSGYAWDFIGFDASYYGSTKFDMKEGNSSSNQLLNADNEGFGKLGQAYVKMKLGNDDMGAKFQGGRQIVYNGLISSSGSRTVPSTWNGYNLTGNIQNIKLGFAYVDQMSLRDQAGFNDLEDFNGNKIDYVMGGEIGYKADGLELLYRNAFSKDFLQAHNAKVGYTIDLADGNSFTIDTRYFTTKEDGNLWKGEAWYAPAFDDKAENYSLNAQLVMNDWTFDAAVSQTKAETSKEGIGKYYYDFGKNTHGIWDVGTSAFGEDFMYDGETAFKVGGAYDFTNLGIKGLQAGYWFHYGTGMKANNKTVSEQEHDIQVIYAFQQPSLKGLTAKVEYGYYTNDKELRDVIGYGTRNDLRAWLDYKFVAF